MNKDHSDFLVAELQRKLRKVVLRSESPMAIRHKERGKLLVRERIELLLDPATPFLELSALATNGMYDDQFPSAGIVTGIGLVQGHETVIIANDATVKGGTYVKETIRKHIRALEIALQNKLPAVFMVDSGGVFLPQQTEVFPDKEHFGRIFYLQSQMSAQSIPQVSIVMGSCTAGGAYIPAMSDEAIIVRNQGTIFLGGPPLVKAATGEEISAEELGGGDVHSSVSGVVDHIAENDQEAIDICRSIFETFRFNKPQLQNKAYKEPIYPANEIYGLIQKDTKQLPDILEIIARIVDGSEFQEFKAAFGKTLITGFARIMGFQVGIIANNGILFSESALKGTHFIDLCDHRKVPLVFLQNISGFMVGREAEHGGIAKNGAKMVHAVATASVPKFTIIIGGSYGAGNYAMAGRAYDPNLLFCWPNAKISVMGGEQAANVLAMIKGEQIQASGGKWGKDEEETLKKEIRKKYEDESSACYSTARIWDDGIIDPQDTREILAMGLAMSGNAFKDQVRRGVYRM